MTETRRSRVIVEAAEHILNEINRSDLIETRVGLDGSHREATDDELLNDREIQRSLKNGRHTVRHFAREISDRRTETGVRHVQRSKMKIYAKDNKLYGVHRGETHQLTASVFEHPNEKLKIIYDVRIKSPYLR